MICSVRSRIFCDYCKVVIAVCCKKKKKRFSSCLYQVSPWTESWLSLLETQRKKVDKKDRERETERQRERQRQRERERDRDRDRERERERDREIEREREKEMRGGRRDYGWEKNQGGRVGK